MNNTKQVLIIGGGDFTAMKFEHLFKGVEVNDIINNLTYYLEKFLRKHPECKDDLTEFKSVELVINKHSLDLIKNHIGDYDYLKTDNIYIEGDTI